MRGSERATRRSFASPNDGIAHLPEGGESVSCYPIRLGTGKTRHYLVQGVTCSIELHVHGRSAYD